MPPLAKTCVALTWTSSGRCYGVRIRGSSDRCRIIDFWNSGPESGESLSGKLITGATALKAGNVDQIVAGGDTPTGAFVDITMPELRAEEQQQALRYELVKYSPLPVDQIAWGYRIVEKIAAGQLRVRLIYLPQVDWENWLEAVRGLVPGVDMLTPPISGLDPVLAGYDVCLGGDEGCWYRDTGARYRDCAAEPGPEAKNFGTPGEPLEAENLAPGALQEHNTEEQHRFAGSTVLGMYGLSREIEKDKRTWVRVPEMIQPHRNRFARTLALVLVLYLVGFGSFQGVKYGLAAQQHYRDLQQRNVELEEKISNLQTPEERMTQIEELRTELEEAAIDRPSLAACLLSLTSRTGEAIWVRTFTWDDGKMSLEAVTTKDDVSLTSNWAESPVLADVVPRRKKVEADNRMTISFRLYASDKGGGVSKELQTPSAGDQDESER